MQNIPKVDELKISYSDNIFILIDEKRHYKVTEVT